MGGEPDSPLKLLKKPKNCGWVWCAGAAKGAGFRTYLLVEARPDGGHVLSAGDDHVQLTPDLWPYVHAVLHGHDEEDPAVSPVHHDLSKDFRGEDGPALRWGATNGQPAGRC